VTEDKALMRLALDEARKAGAQGEVPAGAVLVSSNGEVIARAGNACIVMNDPSAHAEILALRQAGARTRNYRLAGTTLYSTLEPCAMCYMAMVHARLDRLVFGAWEPKTGALGSLIDLTGVTGLNHKIEIEGGILAEESASLLKDFFKRRRGTEVVVTGATRNRLVR
jgi:tRNA(adenine34) deaminase